MAWRQYGKKEEQGDEDRRRRLWERARLAVKGRRRRENGKLCRSQTYTWYAGQPRKLSVNHEKERMTSRFSSTHTWLLQSLFSVVGYNTADSSQNHQQDYIYGTA